MKSRKRKNIKILFYIIKSEFELIYIKMIIITDEQIKDYIEERKIIPKIFKPSLRSKKFSFEFRQESIGALGNVFKIIVRQNKFNPLDFSVIFGVLIGGKLFRIKRYNGDSHGHINKLEKIKIEGFHIHKATQRYQENGFGVACQSTIPKKSWKG